MGKVIAISGKGGTGKTTLAALLVKYLRDKGATPILAVDADPSTNLNTLLGMEVKDTVGGIREDSIPSKKIAPHNIPLSDFIDYQINMALVEGDKYDLIAMGRPEGKGCYCAANSILRDCLTRLTSNYRYAIIDNEAGLEHISRQTNCGVDILFIISNPSIRGITTAIRIKDLIKELENEVSECYLIINRVNGELPQELLEKIKEGGLNLIGTLREDKKLVEYDISGKPLIELSDDLIMYQDLRNILDMLNI